MFTVKISKNDVSPEKWRQIVEALELPEGMDEVIVTRIPGLVPVEEGWKIEQNKIEFPEWLIADDLDRKRWFVLHTKEPRFIAEIADGESFNPPFEYELDSGEYLCNFLWFDLPPEDMTLICEQVNQIIEQYDFEE